MIFALLLAAQLGAVPSPPGRDDIVFMKDTRGHYVGMRDRRNGHVIGRWNRAGYFVAQKPKCEFVYSEELETRALTVLQHELTSEGARFYDGSKPLVTICRKKAELAFGGTLTPEGRSLLDPPHIYIDVDICSHKILAVDRDNGTTITDDPPCA